MSVSAAFTVLTGNYAYLQGADASQGTKPHVLASDWLQMSKKYASTFVPAPASASTDLESAVFTVTPNYASGILLFGAWILPSAAVTANASNFATFQLGSRPQAGGGSQTTIGAALDTHATSWVAVSQVALFTSTSGVAVAQNLVLTVARTHGGTGVAESAYTLLLEFAEA